MTKRLSHSSKVLLELTLADFLLVFGAFIALRGAVPGVFPRWYWLALSALVWASFSILTHKLEFWRFRNKADALWSILLLDLFIYALSFLAWTVFIPEKDITHYQLIPFIPIVLLETGLYALWRYLFKKVQYLYVDIIERPYEEAGMEKAVHYRDSELPNRDLSLIYKATKGMDHEGYCRWVLEHKAEFAGGTMIVDTGDPSVFDNCPVRPELIVCLQPFNHIRHFNTFLAKANLALCEGGTISVHGETSGMRRHRIEDSFPAGIGRVVAFVDYLWSRVFSKLWLTRKFYMTVTRGRHRNFPRVEVLGRIARAGFTICGDEVRSGVYYVSGIRTKDPVTRKPNYGLLIRLPRKSKDGKTIGVFKLRTMYAYSEYIQDYTYQLNGLEKGGKLKNDFRVNLVGHFCRSRFLDELPMLINFFRGDLKLVGVRPLSKHYLSLYSPEMQELHLSVKPGIFPPLYYEFPKPETIEEVQQSERRYIESYLRNPRRTDWKYFWGMLANIIFKKERSH